MTTLLVLCGLQLRRIVPYLCLGAAVCIYLYPFLRILSATPDEGTFLYDAKLVAEGALPFRDFVEPLGPGSFCWLGFWFKLFGATILTARTVLLGTAVATTLLVFYLSRQLSVSGYLAALCATVTMVPWMVMNSPHYDSNVLLLAALALFLQASKPSAFRYPLLFCAGVLTGMAEVCVQAKGLLFLAALMIALLLTPRADRRRSLFMMVCGMAVVLTAELLFYWHCHAIPDLIYSDFQWPLSDYHSVNRARYAFPLEQWSGQWFAMLHARFPALLAMLATLLVAGAYVVVALAPGLAVAAGLFWKAQGFRRATIPYWLAGAALFASELHRFDLGHLRNGVVILMILLLAICEKASVRSRHCGFALSALFSINGVLALLTVKAHNQAIQTRAGTVLADSPHPALPFLMTHTLPQDNVFVYPYRPSYYFLAGVHNPTRYSLLMYGYNTEAQMEEAIADLQTKRVRYVVLDENFAGDNMRIVFPTYREPSSDRQLVENYLRRHYDKVAGGDGEIVLERRR